MVASISEPRVRKLYDCGQLPSSNCWSPSVQDRQCRLLVGRGRELLLLSHNDMSVLEVLLAEWSPRSKEGNGVDPVDAGKEEPGNQKSVYSLLSKLPFRSTIESVEGRDAGEEEEHRHLPDVHEEGPSDGEIVEKIIAPPVTFYEVNSKRGISGSSVEEKNAPGERNPDEVDARMSRRNSIIFNAGSLSIVLIFSCSHQFFWERCHRHPLQTPD